MTRCNGLTSHSDAKISDNFGEGIPDETFIPLNPMMLILHLLARTKRFQIPYQVLFLIIVFGENVTHGA